MRTLCPDIFSPSEENKILAKSLGLDLDEEVHKFMTRHKYAKTQMEFSIWIRGSASYRNDKQENNLSKENKSTDTGWGPGHPNWDVLNKKRGSDPAEEICLRLKNLYFPDSPWSEVFNCEVPKLFNNLKSKAKQHSFDQDKTEKEFLNFLLSCPDHDYKDLLEKS